MNGSGFHLPARWALPPLATLSLVLLGYLLAGIGPQNPEIPAPAQHPSILPNTVGVYPEPLDRFLFLSLGGAAVLMLAFVALAAARLRNAAADPVPVFWSLFAVALITCLWRGAFPEISRVLADGQWLASLVCAGAVAWLWVSPPATFEVRRRTVSRLLFALASIMIASQRIWVLDSAVYHGGPFTSHYEAVTSAMVRITGGSTCLVDVIPQYGCSGEWLAPWFRLVGSGVFALTTTLVVLTIAGLAATMHFAAGLLRHPMLLAGCLLSLTIVVALNLVYDVNDPIFQYFPIRFLFPALSLVLASWYQRTPGVLRSFALGAFAGVALTWNLESGVAVTGALAFLVSLGQFTARPWVIWRHLAVLTLRLLTFAAGILLLLFLFKLYLAGKSGVEPDLTKYVLFQRVFYLIGFGMIPISPFPDYWALYVGLLFATGLLAALHAGSVHDARDRNLELATYLAVLGTGLFLYYTGRSHLLVLRLVAWPATILFFFLLERAWDESRMPRNRRALGATAFLGCLLPAAFLAMTMPSVVTLALSVRNPPQAENAMIREDLDFIRAHAAPAERVAIVAINQSVLYGETGMRATLSGPGVAEMIRVADRDAQVDALIASGPDKLFVGTELEGAVARGQLGTEVGIDLQRIGQAYALEVVGPARRLLLFRRKPFTGPDLLAGYLAETRDETSDGR